MPFQADQVVAIRRKSAAGRNHGFLHLREFGHNLLFDTAKYLLSSLSENFRNAACGSRFDQLELNLNLMAVGQQVPRWISTQMGLSAEALARAGAVSALTGTTDEMIETLQRRRESLGISYIAVGDEMMEGLAPVVERLAGR